MKHDRTVPLAAPAFRAGLEAPRPAPDTVAHPKLGPISVSCCVGIEDR
jgi:hypothetical protein